MNQAIVNAGSINVLKSVVSTLLWKANNFSNCKYKDYLESPAFSSPETTGTCSTEEWFLRIYPKGYKASNKDYVSIYLMYMGLNSVNVTVTLSILDENYRKVRQHSSHEKFGAELNALNCSYQNILSYAYVKNETNRLLINDTINILCEIKHDSKFDVQLKNTWAEESSNYCRLNEFDKFEKLFEEEKSTDVIIKIDEGEIKVHKIIIMNRSPVFQAMFEHEMKEKEQSIVEIADVKYEVMKEVFRFMYVGKVNEIEKLAGDLLVAADKYSIDGLKVLSGNQMLKDLTVANAIEYLKLAEMCNVNDLKRKVIEYIVHNQKDIVHKPELQLLPAELVCEVLRAIVEDHSNK